MKSSLRSLAGTWGVFFLAFLFVTWGVFLISRVSRDQGEVARLVKLIGRLDALEKSIRGLEEEIPLAGLPSEENAARLRSSQYSQHHDIFRQTIDSFDPTSKQVQSIQKNLAAIRTFVGQVGEMRSRMIQPGPNPAVFAGLERESRTNLHRAIDEDKAAVKRSRERLAELSGAITGKWNQLTALVAVSCLLACVVAVLLIVSRQQITQRHRVELALRGAHDELEERVHQRTAELAEANRALRSSEERYRRFFEEDLAGDFICKPDGEFVACNPAFARIFGFRSAEDAMASSMLPLFGNAGQWERFLKLLRKEKKLTDYQTELCRKDGRTVHLVENIVGTFDDRGELTEIKGYVFDSSERKQLEEQLRQAQKMEAVGRLAGGVAHDFNNLLTAITGYSEMILSRLDERDPMHEEVSEIKKAGDRAAALTKQLLALSRRQVVQPQELDLNAIVREMEKMLRRLIGEDIDLVTKSDRNLGRIKADASQLEQVILNLAVNARDAMPSGGMITIETANVELDETYTQSHRAVTPGSYVMLAVSDTGCGMDAETVSHIFEPFFTTKGAGQGTGLGLSMVYGIVAQNNGHLWVYSEPGKGTTFRIYLPRFAEVETKEAGRGARRSASEGTETVLIVEDEQALRELAARVLKKAGYTVLEAARASEAMKLCEGYKDRIDLMMTDVVLPDVSGPELAARLDELRPEMRLLFMSGYPEGAIVRHGVLSPDVAFIQKPFTMHALASKVRKVLDWPARAIPPCEAIPPPVSENYSEGR